MTEAMQRVFISSRITGLEKFRSAAREAIGDLAANGLPIVAIGSERFPAQTGTPQNVCLEEVSKCDVFLGILDDIASMPVIEEFTTAHSGKKYCVAFWIRAKGENNAPPEYAQHLFPWSTGAFVKRVANAEELKYEASLALRNALTLSPQIRYFQSLVDEGRRIPSGRLVAHGLPIDQCIPLRLRRLAPLEPKGIPHLCDLNQVVIDHRTCVVSGPSGSGKTIALRRMVYDVAANYISEINTMPQSTRIPQQDICLPVYVKLLHIRGSLQDLVRSTLAVRSFPGPETVLNPEGRVTTLLLLDGFDEITSDQQKASLLQDLDEIATNKHIRCVVTCKSRRHLMGHFEAAYEIDDLTNSEIKQIFRLHTDQIRGDDLFRLLDVRGIVDSFRRPLMACFAAIAIQDPASMLSCRGAIYQEVFERQLLRQWDAKNRLEPDERRFGDYSNLLGWIGFEMVISGRSSISLQEMRAVVARCEIAGSMVSQAKDIVEALQAHGIVAVAEEGVEFCHQSFRDYFAAAHLAIFGNVRDWVRLAKESKWWEVTIFLVGILPNEAAREVLGELIRSRALRWRMWKASHGFPQNLDSVAFIINALLESRCECEDLKDELMELFEGRRPLVTSCHANRLLPIADYPFTEYDQLCGWLGRLGTNNAIAYLRTNPYGTRASRIGLVQCDHAEILLDLLDELRTVDSATTGATSLILQAAFGSKDPQVKAAMNNILIGDDVLASECFLDALLTYSASDGRREPGFLRHYDADFFKNLIHVACHATSSKHRRAPIACLLNSEERRVLHPSVECQLIEYVNTGEDQVRAAAIAHLADAESDESLAVVRRAAEEEQSLWVRASALEALQLRFIRQRVPGQFAGPLIRCLVDFRALGQGITLQDGDGGADALELYSDAEEDGPIREARLPILIRAARFAQLPFLRCWAMDVLESMGATEAIAPMMEAVEHDESADVRKRALRGLWNMTGARSLPQFRGALRDPEAEVRRYAIKLLPFMSPAVRIQLDGALNCLLDDPDRDVRRLAHEELGRNTRDQI